MDTSKEYIKMCEAAKDIQRDWNPSIGDYLFRKFTIFGEEIDRTVWGDNMTEVVILHYHSNIPEYWNAVTADGGSRTVTYPDSGKLIKATSIWLPRQDQSQEILCPKDWQYALLKLDEFRQPDYFLEVNWKFINSIEKMWFHCVMAMKYNKFWDGEKWVN